MESKDGRYTISVAHDGPLSRKFQVDYTLGARRFQGYLSKLPDGRIYVLPGVLAQRDEALDRLEGDRAGSRSSRRRTCARSGTSPASTATRRTSRETTIRRRARSDTRGPRWASAAKRAMARARPHVAVATEWDKDPLRAPTRPTHGAAADLLAAESRRRGRTSTRAATATATRTTCSSASRPAIATRTTRCRFSSASRFPTTIRREISGRTDGRAASTVRRR